MRSSRLAVTLAVTLWMLACARGTGPSASPDASTDATVDTVLDGPCLPGAYWHCVEGNVHSFDSCENDEGLLWECGLHGECVDVTPTRSVCGCDPGWLGGTCDACGYLVDVDAPAGGDGLSWETAFDTIQEGIDAAHDALRLPGAPAECEVWVSAGTYYVHQGAATDTVRMRAGVMMYGGFNGGQVDRSERDFATNVTRIHGADGPGLTAHVLHVVTGANASLIDGFVITGGVASGAAEDASGAGMLLTGTSPTIANCIFTGNQATSSGGAVAALAGSSPVIEASLFADNTAGLDGGALHLAGGSSVVTGCIFAGNSATGAGGAVSVVSSGTVSISSSVFTLNTAATRGGGVHSSQSTGTVTNCTFTANSASSGGAIWVQDGTGTVTNSILWGDAGGEIGRSASASGTVSHSDVQGGTPGTGNIDADPMFAGVADLHLSAGSPCIDAADAVGAPETDIEGSGRVDDPATADTGSGSPPYVDMGAYEFQP